MPVSERTATDKKSVKICGFCADCVGRNRLQGAAASQGRCLNLGAVSLSYLILVIFIFSSSPSALLPKSRVKDELESGVFSQTPALI